MNRGSGVYWQDNGLAASGLPDWNARSYKTSVVRDAAGTILLVEQANGQGAVGNVWPSISLRGRFSQAQHCIRLIPTQRRKTP